MKRWMHEDRTGRLTGPRSRNMVELQIDKFEDTDEGGVRIFHRVKGCDATYVLELDADEVTRFVWGTTYGEEQHG